jgi:hypothetical protein
MLRAPASELAVETAQPGRARATKGLIWRVPPTLIASSKNWRAIRLETQGDLPRRRRIHAS